VGAEHHAGESGNRIDLGVFEIDVNTHLDGFQDPLPCHFPQHLRNVLIFPPPWTAHVPFAVIALYRFHALVPLARIIHEK
jgi:hypothetical protein